MDAGIGEAAAVEGAKATSEAAVASGVGSATAAGGFAAEDAWMGALASGATGEAAAAASAAGYASGVAGGGALSAAGAGAGLLNTLKTASTILGPVGSILGAASGVTNARAMSRLNGPSVTPTNTMPSPISFQAQQTSFASQAQRRGRASTILTAPDGDKLGG